MGSSKRISKSSSRRITQANNRHQKNVKSDEPQVKPKTETSPQEKPQSGEDGYYVAPNAYQSYENSAPESAWNIRSENGNYSTRGKNEDYDYDEDDQEDENLFITRGRLSGRAPENDFDFEDDYLSASKARNRIHMREEKGFRQVRVPTRKTGPIGRSSNHR